MKKIFKLIIVSFIVAGLTSCGSKQTYPKEMDITYSALGASVKLTADGEFRMESGKFTDISRYSHQKEYVYGIGSNGFISAYFYANEDFFVFLDSTNLEDALKEKPEMETRLFAVTDDKYKLPLNIDAEIKTTLIADIDNLTSITDLSYLYTEITSDRYVVVFHDDMNNNVATYYTADLELNQAAILVNLKRNSQSYEDNSENVERCFEEVGKILSFEDETNNAYREDIKQVFETKKPIENRAGKLKDGRNVSLFAEIDSDGTLVIVFTILK